MTCAACQHGNPPGALFCNACGEPLQATCSRCEHANPPNAHFCNACGSGLGEAAAPASPIARDPRSYTPAHLAERILRQKSALEGERKHVTVLFADLADSTAFAEALGDPEAMHALLDRAFGHILEQVHRYEGTVNQFTGDGVMALFGAPVAVEDAPRCAVLAALAIQEALAGIDAEVRERHDRPFRMRIGIHSGPVVVGSIGDDLRMDYTAVGDTTNLAARLQGLAEPGQVVISDATRRLVEGYFALEALPPRSVKGKSKPIGAFAVRASHGAAGRVEARKASREGLTPYVGREREVETLVASFDAASKGSGRVAFVVGEAGIGKSRLLHEFRARIAERHHAWMEGRCASYARTTPFHALADSMRRAHEIDDRDGEDAVLAKVTARETQLGGGLSWTLPYVRRLLSLPSGDPGVDALDAMTRRAETCRALQARILRGAEQTPQVIVIEDLHWIDAASEEFLSYIADSIAGAHVLLVLTHRPGYQHPFGDRSFHVRVPLQPLSEEDTSAMVGGVLEVNGLPSELRALIASKAEGNPLFIEEVTTSLLEEGVLALEEGRIRLTRNLADVSIPDRIQDVLMARLDRLPEEPKRAIQIASVIGREFALRLLQRVDEAGERLDAVVGELRSLELIYEKASHPELAYMFKHALTHEVAYESVLIQRRKTLHQIVGAAIEELYRDRLAEHYEALAYHFAAAEEWERALRYHEMASEKAAAAYANRSAADHCSEALEIADRLGDVDPERRRVLWVRMGECEWMTSRFGASAHAFERASELSDDPADRALFAARASYAFLWQHEYDRGVELGERALAWAEECGAQGAQAAALVAMDQKHVVCGEDVRNLSRVHRALSLSEGSGMPSVQIFTRAHAAMRAEWEGDFTSALDWARAAISLAEANRSPVEAIFAYWFLGITQVCVGDYGGGIEVFTTALELCERVGDRALRARLLNTLGWAHAEVGAFDRAVDLNRSATELGREIVDLGLVAGAPELYANGAINLAGNLIELGRPDEAAEELAPIQRQLDDDPDPWMRWRWSLHLFHQQARLALARGDLETARVLTLRQREGAVANGARKIACRADALLGRIELSADNRPAAASALSAALEGATAIGYPPVACRAESLLAEWARREGEHSLAEARTTSLRARLAALVPRLGNADLEHDFRRLGERLLERPLG